MKKAFVVSGLGFGDEGKGTTAHWLSCLHRAMTVIRLGGAQALHRAVAKHGLSHVFSQFGAGTLRGSATHLAKHMTIDPHAIIGEGEVLVYELGLRGVFESMTIHEDALVITPFQAICGRVRELMRGAKRHGSVGIGIGETVLDSEAFGDAAIRAGDLRDPDRLLAKLHAIRERKLLEFEELRDRASVIPEEVRARVRKEFGELEDPDTVQWAVERFAELVRRVRIVDDSYVAEKILGPEGTVVIENSQGVLIDRYHGFHPHTTKVRTVPQIGLGLLRELDYDGEVTSLGVLRAYHTRHGAGPFVTESPALTATLPDPSNKEHPWQGNFRVGCFDAVAARYAVAACEGALDGLVITCVDRIEGSGRFDVCGSYKAPPDVLAASEFFCTEQGRIVKIKVGEWPSPERLERQERLGVLLRECAPQITTLWSDRDGFRELCVRTIEGVTGVPVVAMSVGETEADKISIK